MGYLWPMRILFSVIILCLASLPLHAAGQAYRLDPHTSRVGFIFDLGGEPSTGEMPVRAAEIALDFDDLSRSQINITVAANKVRTGFLLATEALRAANMLDTRRHPDTRFVSRKIFADGTKARIEGLEDMFDQTKLFSKFT